MRFIFIVVFLVSFGSVSMGGVGDVYYCDVVSNTETTFMTEALSHEKKGNISTNRL